MKWDLRKIDQLEFRRARVYCTDGKVYVGRGDCVCDASEGDGQDIEGIWFHADDGTTHIWTEDEIEKIELLDE